MPLNPQYYSPSSSGSQYIFGAEYQISGVNNHADERNIPCALCQAIGCNSMIMIPSHHTCPSGWHMECNGYIMTKLSSSQGSSMYHCVDKGLQQLQIPGSAGNEEEHRLYTTYTVCGHYFPCN